MVIARAWTDEAYKQRFLSDPQSVLAEEGVTLPADVNVKVVEDTEIVTYINLTRDLAQAAPQSIVQLVQRVLPIPADHEVRLVQSSDTTRYLVLPRPPAGTDLSQVTEPELMAIVADAAVQTETIVTTVGEVAEAVTSGVEFSQAATTVVVAAELVAT